MIIKNGPERVESDGVVLFPFDDFSLPFKNGLRLHLVPYKSPVDRTRIVVAPGPAGAPDDLRVIYYGSVRKVGDELWMWYLGQGDADTDWMERVCLAKSKDGYHWEKPNLGLVGYRGSKENNLVDMLGGEHSIVACVVFYEPDEPNPKRRFKAIIETKYRSKLFGVMFSEDGLTWNEFEVESDVPAFEPSGGTKFNGCYYLNGHGGSHFGAVRQMVTYASYDFEHWTLASCVGLRRGDIPPRPMLEGFAQGEQIHLGASLWNRGNVVVGLYGQWHGPLNNDRRHVEMDLGLVVSNDCLHFTEPIPDFRIVAAAEDGFNHLPRPWLYKHSAFAQGQGFENIGDETLFWYAPWPEQLSDGVRLATWKRDRLGFLKPFDPKALKTPNGCHVISAPIDLQGRDAEISLNIDGLSEHARVTIDVLDEQFRPLAGYSGDECLPIESGLKQGVSWKKNKAVRADGSAVRVRLNYTGVRPEDPELYAIYVDRTK